MSSSDPHEFFQQFDRILTLPDVSGWWPSVDKSCRSVNWPKLFKNLNLPEWRVHELGRV